jgi:hypothetical protein
MILRARREQEENLAEAGRISNDRSRFELAGDQIVFGLKLLLTVFFLVALVVSVATGMEAAAVVVSCGGTIGGVISLLFGRHSV